MADTADTADVIVRPPIAWALAVLANHLCHFACARSGALVHRSPAGDRKPARHGIRENASAKTRLVPVKEAENYPNEKDH